MKRYKKFIQVILTIFSITILIQYVHAADSLPIGQENIPGGSTAIPGGSVPGGSTGDIGITSDVLGQKGGMFHPFIILEEMFTDNLFATHSSKKSSFITTIAPGIWLASPGTRIKQLQIDTTPTAPGGLHLSRIKPEGGRRYQSYFLYSPEYVMYSGYSKHDHLNHKAEGLFQVNLKSGLSFDLVDVFHDRETVSGDGLTDTLYRYQDNLLDFITTYDPENKFKFQLAFSNYDLSYKDFAVSNRNRNDKTYGLSVFYKFWPKTDLFVEYNHSDIEFDTAKINDSIENRYYVGADWDITDKTNGAVKVGFIEKDFDSPAVADQDGVSFELRLQHELSAKRSIKVTGYRKFHESDMAAASSFLSTGVDLNLDQKITEKWSASLNIFYERNEYNGIGRDDDVFGFGPAIRFEPREWLFFDLGYYYYQNNSNDIFYDFDINQIFLRATLYM